MKLLFKIIFSCALLFSFAVNAKPEPRPTFDNVTVTAALHSGPFVNAWGPHVKRIKELYGINLELVGIPVNELYDKWIDSIDWTRVIVVDTNNFNVFKDKEKLKTTLENIRKSLS